MVRQCFSWMAGVVFLLHPAFGEGKSMSELRKSMVESQIRARGVKDTAVLDAVGKVPRHEFVPDEYDGESYDDHPLPIGHGQTISQPYIVAYMSEMLELGPGDRVLEIGTGSGYQAAVLAEIADEVYTIEIVPELARSAEAVLKRLGYDNVHVRLGDGYKGWPEHAPFDKIIVTAAPPHIPEALVEQLEPGGLMAIPVGTFFQELLLVRKTEDGFTKKTRIPVRFVPMVHGKE